MGASPKLQGYESFDAFENFQQKPKVARLQRLRGLYLVSVDDLHWHPQSYEVTKVLMLLKIFNKKQRLQISQLLKHFICHEIRQIFVINLDEILGCPKSYEVTKVTILFFNFS